MEVGIKLHKKWLEFGDVCNLKLCRI